MAPRKTPAKKAPAKKAPAKKAPAKKATASSTPEGLHESGLALWNSLGREVGTAAGQVALEACRCADRLDELARIVEGKGVLNLLSFRLGLDLEAEDGSREIRATVEFSGVLSEARQQQMTLKALLKELGIDAAAATPAAPKGSPLDELTAARRAREAKAPRRSSRR